MNIAAYCRVSTDTTDQLGSLEAQKQFFTTYTEKHGHTLTRLYADEGLSGTKTKNRKAFLQLLRDAALGQFELVVVKDISRFARNTVDFLQSIRTLKALGVETIFLTSNQTVLGNSEFVLTIFGALAQEESANTSKRVKFGKKLNAEKGRVPNLAYGYDKTPGDYFHLEINAAEAAVVRQIFQWYTKEGCGALKIAKRLNQSGLKTKRGCAWSQNAVARILKNELYTGKVINGKQEVADFLTGVRVSRDKDSWMISDRPDLRIIAPECFAQAQTLLAKRNEAISTKQERPSNAHLFSLLIRCKDCGHSFRRIVRHYQNTSVRWVCGGRNTQGAGACPNAVSVDETALMDALQRFFAYILKKKPDLTRSVVRACNRRTKEIGDDEAKELRCRLRKLERVRQKNLDLYAEELLTHEELTARLKPVREEIDHLRAALQQAEELQTASRRIHSVSSSTCRAEDIASLQGLNNAALRRIVKTIVVNRHGQIDIHFHRFDRA